MALRAGIEPAHRPVNSRMLSHLATEAIILFTLLVSIFFKFLYSYYLFLPFLTLFKQKKESLTIFRINRICLMLRNFLSLEFASRSDDLH